VFLTASLLFFGLSMTSLVFAVINDSAQAWQSVYMFGIENIECVQFFHAAYKMLEVHTLCLLFDYATAVGLLVTVSV